MWRTRSPYERGCTRRTCHQMFPVLFPAKCSWKRRRSGVRCPAGVQSSEKAPSRKPLHHKAIPHTKLPHLRVTCYHSLQQSLHERIRIHYTHRKRYFYRQASSQSSILTSRTLLLSTGVEPELNLNLKNVAFIDRGRARLHFKLPD